MDQDSQQMIPKTDPVDGQDMEARNSMQMDIPSSPEPSTEEESVPWLYTLIMTLLSTTEGYTLGYMNSLMSIFREKGVSSDRIGLVTVIMYPIILAFLGAPVVDRYFSSKIGKRKTYLLPSKLVLALAFFIYSFIADKAVDDLNIKLVSWTYFCIGLVQLADYNALAGLRYEMYGPKGTGTATFTFYTGMILGSVSGYQCFILLNSDYVFKDILGVKSGKVLSHRGINLFFALTNLAGFVGCLFLKEKTNERSSERVFLSNWTLLKIFFTDKLHLKTLCWLFFSCFGIVAIKDFCSLQLIKKGFRREYTVFSDICVLPIDIICGFFFRKLMVPGQLIRVCSYLIVLHLVLISVVLYIVDYYEGRKDQELTTFFLYALSNVTASVSPWMQCHFAFVNAITHKKFAATYSATFLGIVNLGKIIPVSISISLLDFVNFTFLFCLLQLSNLAFTITSYFCFAKSIDKVEIEEYGNIVDKRAKLK